MLGWLIEVTSSAKITDMVVSGNGGSFGHKYHHIGKARKTIIYSVCLDDNVCVSSSLQK
jgi:hypothetical protein